MIYIGYTKGGDDKLWEFFDVQGIKKTFLPETKDQILVDVIQHLTSTRSGDIFFLEPYHMIRLYEEKSKWNDISKLIKDRHLRIVLYRHTDVITDLADQFYLDRNFLNWLNELEIPIIIDGKMGQAISDMLKKCEIIQLRPYYSGKYWLYQLNPIKKHKPDKDFFCLMHDIPMRDHRTSMFNQLTENKLLDNGICNFKNDRYYAEDLDSSYGSEYIRSIESNGEHKPFFPIIEYYNRTWIEIAVETMGRSHDTDSFYCTEKTLKPIGMSHPFMVLACQHHLKNLRDIGFKTFGDHIDESYDGNPNMNERCKIISKNLSDLKGRCEKLYLDTKHIREHNLKTLSHLYGEYNLEWWNTMMDWWKNFKGPRDGK